MVRSNIPRDPQFLGRMSSFLVCGMLVACLWPFHAPKNTVSWASGRHAVVFGLSGVLLSSDSLTVPGDPEASSCSLELWLRPDPSRDLGSILAIYSAENPRQLTIEQWHTGFAVRSASIGDPVRTGSAQSYTHGVFAPGKAVFVTVTSGERGTEVYVDGTLRKVTPSFRITNKMLSGKMVAGTAATTAYAWPGELRGLGIYGYTLSSTQVLRHLARWTSTIRPNISDLDGPLALYVFAEGTGNRLRDEAPGGIDLYMPAHYVIPAKRALAPPDFDHLNDIIANIIGFVPLGFTLCGYLLASRRMRPAVVATAAICGAFSLLIESIQILLPTRDSSMTDVITNILGGAIGALLYRWSA
jgi:hypothetical protein